MTTRAASALISEIRTVTNRTDSSGRYTDSVLLKFLNSAQRAIQRAIFLSNPENNFFNKQQEISLVAGTESYDLASDIYGRNSVAGVALTSSTGQGFTPLRKLDWKARTRETGYIVYNNKILISPIPTASDRVALVNYQAALTDFASTASTSELPANCEEFLMLYVERKIHYTDSSDDVSKSDLFTKEEKEELMSLFAEINQDVGYPAIDDDTYVNY